MQQPKWIFWFLCFVVTGFLSCNLEQRHYRAGYYTSFSNKVVAPGTQLETGKRHLSFSESESKCVPVHDSVGGSDSTCFNCCGDSISLQSVCQNNDRLSDSTDRRAEDSIKCVRRIKVSSAGLAVVSAITMMAAAPFPFWLVWPLLLIVAIIIILRLRRALKTYRETRDAATRKETSGLPLWLAIASLVLAMLAWIFVLGLDLPAIALGFAIFSFGAAVLGFLNSLSRIRAYRPSKEHKAVEGSTIAGLAIAFTMGIMWVIVSAIITFFIGWGVG